MLQSIFVQNFRAWEDQTFVLEGENAVFVGQNESGKTSILQALDCFFNQDSVDPSAFRNPNQDIAIGARYQGTTFKKTFSAKTHRVASRYPASQWHQIESLHFLCIPATRKPSAAIMRELARTRFLRAIGPDLMLQIEQAAQQSLDEVLATITDANRDEPASVAAKPHLIPAKALDVTIERAGKPVDEQAWGYNENLTYAMLVSTNYDNLVLGIDDIENAFSGIDHAALVRQLGDNVAQLLVTTHSKPVVQQGGLAITVPVGSKPDGQMAHILQGLGGAEHTFLLVEGKYDLPWYRTAAALAGYGEKLSILPAGGTNLDELRREMANLGMRCIAIVDGDTKPDERVGKYALERECVELYTPNGLLRDLFGLVPPKTGKREFFGTIQASRQASENGIKAAISEHISQRLGPSSLFVTEISAILNRATSH